MSTVPSLPQDKIDAIASHASESRPIVVMPHDNPDVDAIVSAAMCHLVFERLGIPSVVCLRTFLDEITARIVDENRLMHPLQEAIVAEIPPEAPLVLVDWFSVPECPNHVAAVFDHHPTSQKICADVVEECRYNSATKLVYDLFCSDNPRFDDIRQELVRNVLFTVFVDSNSMKSTRFIEEDVPWIEEMIKRYGIERDALVEAGYLLNDLSEPVSKLARNGAKRYVLPNGKHGFISYIMASDYDHRLDEGLASEMRKLLSEGDELDYAWHMVCDLGRDRTFVYKLSRSDLEARQDGVWETHHANLSRATDVYPVMEAENRI